MFSPSPFFCKPAHPYPLFSVFSEPSARVIVTFPVLSSAILNAAVSLIDETSIFTPASVIFASTHSATSILLDVAVDGSVFAIVKAMSDLMVSTPSA